MSITFEPFDADSDEAVYDDEFLTSDLDQDPLLELHESPYISDLETLAVRYIRLFFNGKKMYYGGPIPRNLPTLQRYIDRVLSTDVDSAVEAIYAAWHTAALGVVTLKEVQRANRIGRIPSDVEAVIAVQNECVKLKIPKPLSGGITMMYFEFCEGFNFEVLDSPISINVA